MDIIIRNIDRDIVDRINELAKKKGKSRNEFLKDQVKQVSATSTENTTLTLDSNVEIAFGAASDVRDKERVIKQILADHPGEVSYINVRVVKSPTWRTA